MKILTAQEFSQAIRPYWNATKFELLAYKEECRKFGEDPDWPWPGFIQSFATLGGSKNLDRVKTRWSDFSWTSVSELSDDDRKRLFSELPNARFRERVAGFLEQVFQRFKEEGGPAVIRRHYEASKDRVAYLHTFPGIGDKYARNIPMDICDPVVTERFALDHRLKHLLRFALPSSFSYAQGEQFLNEVTRLLDADSWSIDRLLYSKQDEIESALMNMARP